MFRPRPALQVRAVWSDIPAGPAVGCETVETDLKPTPPSPYALRIRSAMASPKDIHRVCPIGPRDQRGQYAKDDKPYISDYLQHPQTPPVGDVCRMIALMLPQMVGWGRQSLNASDIGVLVFGTEEMAILHSLFRQIAESKLPFQTWLTGKEILRRTSLDSKERAAILSTVRYLQDTRKMVELDEGTGGSWRRGFARVRWASWAAHFDPP